MGDNKKLFEMDCAKTGVAIKNKRKSLGISAIVLADKLNVSRIAVHKWEAGYNFPDLPHIYAMAKIFKCKVDDLIVGK